MVDVLQPCSGRASSCPVPGQVQCRGVVPPRDICAALRDVCPDSVRASGHPPPLLPPPGSLCHGHGAFLHVAGLRRARSGGLVPKALRQAEGCKLLCLVCSICGAVMGTGVAPRSQPGLPTTHSTMGFSLPHVISLQSRRRRSHQFLMLHFHLIACHHWCQKEDQRKPHGLEVSCLFASLMAPWLQRAAERGLSCAPSQPDNNSRKSTFLPCTCERSDGLSAVYGSHIGSFSC